MAGEDDEDDTPIGMLPSGELATPDAEDDDTELEEIEAMIEEAEEESQVAADAARQATIDAREQERHDMEMTRLAAELVVKTTPGPIAPDKVAETLAAGLDRLNLGVDEMRRIAMAPRKLVRDEKNRPQSSVVDLGDGT